MRVLSVTAVLWFASVSNAWSTEFSYADCLLAGLRGVGSDAAASMVKRACEQKQHEQKALAEDELRIRYGDELSYERLQQIVVSGWQRVDPTTGHVRLTNNLELTLTYSRIRVGYAAEGGACKDERAFAYESPISPGALAAVALPLPNYATGLCVRVVYGRARPLTWRDQLFASWGAARPLAADLFSTRADGEQSDEDRRKLIELISATLPRSDSRSQRP